MTKPPFTTSVFLADFVGSDFTDFATRFAGCFGAATGILVE